MENFIYEYFIHPILARTGYNIVNTTTYAVVAIILLFLIFKQLRKMNIEIDQNFVIGALSFVLLGSTIRVITDSIDTKVFTSLTPIHEIIIKSHIYDYGYLTVTPGIYIVTASIFLLTVFVLHKFKKKMDGLWICGLLLWLPHFLLILPFSKHFIFLFLIILLALLPFLIAKKLFKDDFLAGIVGAHALDGAATFIAIDIVPLFINNLAYYEQHVFSRWLGEIGGTFMYFYFIKIIISFIAAWLIKNEKMDENEKNYLALILIIMGLAPGIRDMLRLLLGA